MGNVITTAKKLVISSRPWSFPMTVVSVLVGTLSAAGVGSFKLFEFVLVMIGMVVFHGATNLINDYFDYQNDVDVVGSPTTKYRKQPVVEGWFSPKGTLLISLAMYSIVLAIGITLSFTSGPLVLAFGFFGMLASYLYTGKPVGYKYSGWGELSVFLMWGPLIVSGAYYVQTGYIGLDPILLSLPLGILVALVLLADNIRDIDYDRGADVRTIATRLGKSGGLMLYLGLIVLAYAVIGVTLVFGIMSSWGGIIFLSVPFAVSLSKSFWKRVPDDADARTAKLDVLFGSLMSLAMILGIYA